MTTTDTTAPLSAEQIDALGREYDSLMKVAAATEARMIEIRKLWAANLAFGAHPAGDLKVSIQHNITRDNAAFAAAYPFDDYPDFYKPTPDTKTINDLLAPADLRRFQREGAPKVVVTRFED